MLLLPERGITLELPAVGKEDLVPRSSRSCARPPQAQPQFSAARHAHTPALLQVMDLV
jgi:hypothetical protein